MFGAKAVDAMRMEKGFLHWKADLITEYDPFETGLDRFVKMDKPDFIGKDALAARVARGKQVELVTMTLDSTNAAAHGGASVMVDDAVVGTVSSGDWGYRVGQNLAYAFVKPDYAAVGTTFEVDVLGIRVPCLLYTSPSPRDKRQSRMPSSA